MKQTTEINDIKLYKEFITGNTSAFNEIIKKYRKPLISFIFRYVKNIDVAEDISQDTFVYILFNKKEYDFKYSLKTYIYTIAKSRTINYLKRHKREVRLDEQYYNYFYTETEIDKNIIKEENKNQILNAISKMKTEYQTIIYLRDFEEFKYNEICTILNKTMPQVKSLLHRARKQLKKIIKKEEFI